VGYVEQGGGGMERGGKIKEKRRVVRNWGWWER